MFRGLPPHCNEEQSKSIAATKKTLKERKGEKKYKQKRSKVNHHQHGNHHGHQNQIIPVDQTNFPLPPFQSQVPNFAFPLPLPPVQVQQTQQQNGMNFPPLMMQPNPHCTNQPMSFPFRGLVTSPEIQNAVTMQGMKHRQMNNTVLKRSAKTRKPKEKVCVNSSLYKGVAWNRRDRCYMARVWIQGKSMHIGSFQEEMKAALAVDDFLKTQLPQNSRVNLNFENDFQRDIARIVLKHSSAPNFGQVVESTDKNGHPNSVLGPLVKTIQTLSKRKRNWSSESDQSRKSSKKSAKDSNNEESSSISSNSHQDSSGSCSSPRWEALKDAAKLDHKPKN